LDLNQPLRASEARMQKQHRKYSSKALDARVTAGFKWILLSPNSIDFIFYITTS
jgi:hypothetical protein